MYQVETQFNVSTLFYFEAEMDLSTYKDTAAKWNKPVNVVSVECTHPTLSLLKVPLS